MDVKNNLRTLTILVIEDDPGSRSALRSLLEACQYNVIEAEDGEEGWLRISRDHPDLVLMDIMMPVVDGLTLTRKLRSLEEFREIPIIAVTAMEGVRQLAMDAGCDAYLAKPFEITGLLTTISELLAVSTRSRR
ncbi:MAG: response regulator [Gemmatimonadota bacterium]|nr:response regulator [Gemmatimonadota bacterium]